MRIRLIKGFAMMGAAAVMMSISPAPAGAAASAGWFCKYDGSNIRSAPRLNASIVTTCSKGQQIGLNCQITGDPSNGSTVWYGRRGVNYFIHSSQVYGSGGFVKC